MTFTYDPSTDRGRVRLLIPDAVEENETFSDAEIDAFLFMGASDVFLAAATAIETIAGSEAMVLKVMTVMGTSTNGAAVCSALLARAEKLRAMAGSAGLAGDAGFAGGEYVGIATAANDQWTHKEIVG